MLTRAQIESARLVQMEDGSEAPPAHFDKTSYNLRLGRQYCLISGSDHEQRVGDCATGTGILRLPPFACALVSTEEIVKLPASVAGRWGLKIRPAMSGLVFQAGPQIEPGSFGRLFGLLFNLSSSERTLHHLTPLWSIDFESVRSGVNDDDEASESPTLEMRAYTQLGLPSGSLNEIYSDYQRLQRENSSRREIGIVVFLAIVTLIVSTLLPVVVSKVTYDRDDSVDIFQRQQQLISELDSLEKKLDEIRTGASTPPTSTTQP